MKTNPTLLITLGVALTGSVIAILGNVIPAAALRGDVLFAIFLSAAFALKFARDFSRRSTLRQLTVPTAPVLRPAAPIFIDARTPAARPASRPAINHDIAA
jgi:hypothetical protein